MSTSQLSDARRLAGLELNALRFVDAIPEASFEGARIAAAGTPVYDLNGELLLYRFPVAKRGAAPGFVDVAAHPALGAPLVAVSLGFEWNEKALLEQAAVAARKQQRGELKYDEVRFVAYSFPKVGVQFLAEREEVLLLELGTWAPVPPAGKEKRKPLTPENFERWSLLNELSPARKRAAAGRYETRVKAWSAKRFGDLDITTISKSRFADLKLAIKLYDSRELHYSADDASHATCYELYGQLTNVWCVAASTQMLLAFYRYGYTQDRIATALGLGTRAVPNGLPYARVGDVVTQLEALSSNALTAAMVANPSFAFFRTEIRANRPLISFIPGHSRSVAGYIQYTLALAGMTPFRGLLVYDPWPPTTGVITRWENFDAQTYVYGYSAQVTTVP
jgi:hypothetical protein